MYININNAQCHEERSTQFNLTAANYKIPSLCFPHTLYLDSRAEEGVCTLYSRIYTMSAAKRQEGRYLLWAGYYRIMDRD